MDSLTSNQLKFTTDRLPTPSGDPTRELISRTACLRSEISSSTPFRCILTFMSSEGDIVLYDCIALMSKSSLNVLNGGKRILKQNKLCMPTELERKKTETTALPSHY